MRRGSWLRRLPNTADVMFVLSELNLLPNEEVSCSHFHSPFFLILPWPFSFPSFSPVPLSSSLLSFLSQNLWKLLMYNVSWSLYSPKSRSPFYVPCSFSLISNTPLFLAFSLLFLLFLLSLLLSFLFLLFLVFFFPLHGWKSACSIHSWSFNRQLSILFLLPFLLLPLSSWPSSHLHSPSSFLSVPSLLKVCYTTAVSSSSLFLPCPPPFYSVLIVFSGHVGV